MSTCSPSGKRIGNISGNMVMAMVLLLLLLHSPWAISSDSERNKSISDIYWLDCSGSMARLDSALNTVNTMTFEELRYSGVPLMDITPNGKEILVSSGGYLYRIDADTLTLKTDRIAVPEEVSIRNIFPITDDITIIGGLLPELALKTLPNPPPREKTFIWKLKTNETKSWGTSEMGQQNVRMSRDQSYMYIMTERYICAVKWPRGNATEALSFDAVFLSYDARGVRPQDLRGWEVDWKQHAHDFWCFKRISDGKYQPLLLQVKSSEDVRKISTLFTGWPRKGIVRKTNPSHREWRTPVMRWNDTKNSSYWNIRDKVTLRQLSHFGYEWFDDGAESYDEPARLSPDGKWILVPVRMAKDIPGAEAENVSSPEDEADGQVSIGSSDDRATHDIHYELRAVKTKTGRMVKAVRIGEGSTFVIRKR